MSDDSMNWEIVFNARIGSGVAQVTEALTALGVAQEKLIENNVAVDESFKASSEELSGLAASITEAQDRINGLSTTLKGSEEALIAFGAASRESFKEVENEVTTLEGRYKVLGEAQKALADAGLESGLKGDADSLKAVSDNAKILREQFGTLGAEMRVVGGDRLQNLSGRMDAVVEQDRQSRKQDSDLIKAWMLERERLFSMMLQTQTLAGRLNYNAGAKIDNTTLNAQKAIPTVDVRAQGALAKAAEDARAQVQALTKAFEEEGLAASAAGKGFTSAEQTAREQELRQSIDSVTTAYSRTVEGIKTQAKAADDAAKAEIRAAEDVTRAVQEEARTQARLREVTLSSATTAAGIRYPAITKIDNAAYTTSKAIPSGDFGAMDKLDQKTRDAEREVRALTKAFEDEGKAAAAAGKEFSPAEQTARLQEVRQKVNEVTTAFVRETEVIRTQSRATEEATLAQERGLASATRQVRAAEAASKQSKGLGNFYPLIVAAGIFGGLARKAEDLGLAAGKMAAEYETAFASVARTTNTSGGNASVQIDSIRKSLLQLDTQIPLSFQELSKIATAGNEIGISAAGITGFTKTVAEYSAVTGTAADVTATAFGSLGKILEIPTTEYGNFGSAVSLVGRKSVATEAQVLAMTAKIGASAHQANFTTSQILGLSGALASLQEAPERSQGALEIYFKNVNSAAAEGGKKLEAYAAAVHMSTEAAQEMIKNNPYGFLLQLLQAIGNQKGIVAQTTMLQGLGLSAVRVSEVLRRLSTNTDLLGHLTSLASQGYAEGTDLSNQYAKATDTLDAKFKELKNSFDNLLATIGGSGLAQTLTTIIVAVKSIVISITDFAQANPVVTNLVVAFAAFAGILLAVRAATLAATIATIALESAQVRLDGVSKLDGLKTLITLLTNIPIKTNAATVASKALAAQQLATIESMRKGGVFAGTTAEGMKLLGIAELGVAADANVATGAMTGLKAAFISLGIPALLILFTTLGASIMTASDSAANFDSSGLTDALKADEATYEKTGKSIKQITVAVEESSTATDGWVKANDKASGGQKTLDGTVRHTTKSIQDQTVAFGANAKAALENAVANDSAFNKIFSDHNVRSGLAKVGFDPAEFAKRLVNDPTGSAGRKYIQEYEDKIIASLPKRARGGISGSDAQNAALTELRDLGDTVDTVRAQTEKSAAMEAAFAASTGGAARSVQQETSALQIDEQVKADTAAQTAALAKTEDDLMTSLFGPVNAFYAQTSALSTMGQEYVNNGAAAAFSGAAFQGYIKSVIDADPSHAADNLTKLRNSIVDGGLAASAAAPELDYLNGAINELGGQTGTTKQASDVFPAFINGLKQAEAALNSTSTAADGTSGSLGKMAKQIITVTDYAGNLTSTFKEAFDIRFGKQQGLDDISLQFQSMQDNAKSAKKAVEDAKRSIQQYEASISKTRADNANQKYFLSVANQFGDSARAGEIQGQIDQNNASIAGDPSSMKQAQLDLAAAEDKLSTSYTSNTAGAIGNREALYTLAQKYEDYIGKLAASGASQKTLNAAVAKAKEDFEKQATALGYSKSAIDKVSGAFGDMTTIIKKIPPANVKITGLSAGEAAVKDFMTKLAATVSSGVKGINHSLDGIGSHIPVPKLKDPNSVNSVLASLTKSEALYLNNMFNTRTDGGSHVSNADLSLLRSLRRLQRDLATHDWNDAASSGLLPFAEGGYTGQGGKYQAAGVVHKGEYVVPAYMVNQNTGLPYADALGRLISGVSAQASSYAHGGYVGGDMMVTELGPRSLGVLRQLVNNEVVALISAQNLTNAVNGTNANNRRRGR